MAASQVWKIDSNRTINTLAGMGRFGVFAELLPERYFERKLPVQIGCDYSSRRVMGDLGANGDSSFLAKEVRKSVFSYDNDKLRRFAGF